MKTQLAPASTVSNNKGTANKGTQNAETTSVAAANVESTIASEYEAKDKPQGTILSIVKASDKIEKMNENTRPVFSISSDKLEIVLDRKEDSVHVSFEGYSVQDIDVMSFEPNTYGKLYQQYVTMPPCVLFGSRTCADTPELIAAELGIPLAYATEIFNSHFVPVFDALKATKEDALPKTVSELIEEMKDSGFAERNIRAMFSFQKGRFDGVFRPVAKALPTKILLISLASIPDKDIQITFTFEKESDRKALHEAFKNGTSFYDSYLLNRKDFAKLSLYADSIATKYNGEAETKFVPKVVLESELDETSIL